MRRMSLSVLAMILISTVALAEPGKGPGAPGEAKGEKHEGKGGDRHDDKSDKHDEKTDAGKVATGDDDDDEGPATDGGKPVAGRRTPAQLAFRKAIWERREKALEAKAPRTARSSRTRSAKSSRPTGSASRA